MRVFLCHVSNPLVSCSTTAHSNHDTQTHFHTHEDKTLECDGLLTAVENIRSMFWDRNVCDCSVLRSLVSLLDFGDVRTWWWNRICVNRSVGSLMD